MDTYEAGIGHNNPPEPMPDVSALPPLEAAVVLMKVRSAPKVQAAEDFAAARPTEVDAENLEAAAKFVKDGRTHWRELDELRAALKKPYSDAAQQVQDHFKGALDALEAAGKAVNRLIGEHNDRVAEAERKAAALAAAKAKEEAERRLAVADNLLEQGLEDAADGVADTGVKMLKTADKLSQQAAGSTADLARVRTSAGTVSSKVEWSQTITDSKALRKTLGKLGDHFTQADLEKAIRAFRVAEVKAGREPELKGVTFTKGSIGVVR